MAGRRLTALLLLAATHLASAAPGRRQTTNGTCSDPIQRKPWTMLTSDEKSAYIDAELCLMSAPPKLNVTGAQNRWDELHWTHIIQTSIIHDTGSFLPWHRYFVTVHAHMLRDECGYTGSIPYWDQTSDGETLTTLTDSEVFQADAFGGDGVGTGMQNCIEDGPFANTTIHLRRLGTDPGSYCIYRSLNIERIQQGASQENIDACMALDTYDEAWECWHGSPHNSGHGGTGGLMGDVVLSPGDPVFFLHHTFLDALWWRWQAEDLDNRLTDMSGRNIASDSYISGANLEYPGTEFTDYFGDGANITTLNHVLYMADVASNVTIGDIMDVRGDVVCAEYVYAETLA